MAVKTTGLEIKQFFEDKEYWSESGSPDRHTWYDDAVFTVEGETIEDITAVADTAIVKLEGGVVFGAVVGAAEPSLESYFKRWRKAQSNVTLVVTVEKSREAELRAFAASIGATIGV